MVLVSAVISLFLPALAHASSGGALRTIGGQAGVGGLLLLEIMIFHLSGARDLRPALYRLCLAVFTLGLLVQYAFASFVTLSPSSVLLLPLMVVLLSLLLLPLLALGHRLPRRWLIAIGWAALSFLLVLTFAIRLHSGRLFDWYAVRQELSFAASYNWRFGPVSWFLGFFHDDFMRLFWWSLTLVTVSGAFLVEALVGPRKVVRKPPAKQMPLYAPRRSARRKQR